MKFMARSLYAKIFLWFCLTIFASTLLVLLVAGLTGSQPFGRRWMAVTQDLYAHSAVDFYTTGGAPSLERYLSSIRQDTGIDGHLLNAQGIDVLGAPFPSHAMVVYRQADRSGQSAARLGRYWVAASVITAPNHQRYIFTMEAFPLRGFLDGTFLYSMAPRLAGGVVLVALFCLLLARHITRPIRVLQAAATQMAAGDLSVRTLPTLAGRGDELAAMAAAFDSMAARIEALLHMQRQMLADVSHELRSPLTRIGVSLELLRRGETDVLETMQADLDRLNGMIGQVLELTRIDLQEPAISRQPVDLVDLLADIVESANHEGRSQGKMVVLQALRPCIIPGEEAMLRSALENIVRNAVEYTPAATSIDVVLRQDTAGLVVIEVNDCGPGVPEAALPHLFAPFFRVPGSAAAHPHGTGLGLSISARIIQRHGGTVFAMNRAIADLCGLCVTVTLPINPL